MKSSKSTLILALILGLLWVGYWGMLQLEKSRTESEIAAGKVFDLAAGDILRIELRVHGEKPVLAVREEGGPWSFEKPYPTVQPNQNAWRRISNALEEMMDARVIDEAPENLEMYGLDVARTEMDVTLKSGEQFELRFGMLDPTLINRYTQLSTRDDVFLVSDRTFKEFARPLKELRFPYIFDVPEDGIKRLEYTRIRKTDDGVGEISIPVIVERTEEGPWRMVEPLPARANQEVVAALITELRYATGKSYVDDPEDYGDYRLDPAGAKVTITVGDGEEQTLYLGGHSSGEEDSGLLVKRENSPSVITMDGHLLTLLPKTPNAFRERRLFVGDATKIRKAEYRSGDTLLRFEKDDETGWHMTQPKVDDTDEAAVSVLISQLKVIEARRFLDKRLARYGLDNPELSWVFEFEGLDQPVAIVVGGRAPEPEADYFYATQDDGKVVTVSGIWVDMLRSDAFRFRRKGLMPFAQSKVRRMSLTCDGVAYAFVREGAKWRLEAPEGKSLQSQSDAKAILESLGAAEIEAIEEGVDGSHFGFDQPVIEARVFVEKDDASGVATEVLGPLMIGAVCGDEGEQRFARVEGRGDVVRVSQALVDDLREALKGVR